MKKPEQNDKEKIREKLPKDFMAVEKNISLLKKAFTNVGDMVIFSFRVIKQFFQPPFEHRELVKQAYNVGNRSFLLIAITGLIMGLVLTLQSQPILTKFGAQSLIPGMVAISVLREIGPVITGLIGAGRIGSGIAAEIGAMKVTEQIDAMEVSGTKPLGFVVASRVIATTIMIPLLVFFSDAFSLLGSYLGMNLFESMSIRLFLKNAFDMLSYIDIIPSTIKSIVFGFSIGIIGAFKGYHAGEGTEAVGKAANSAVVTASLAIFVIDLVAVLIVNLL